MVIGLAAGTLTILGTLLILFAAFAGIGFILRRACGLTTLDLDDCFLGFWTGFGVVILILILWNFFLPVGLSALLFVLALGGAGIVWSWKALVTVFDHDAWRPHVLDVVLLTIVALWVANQSMAGFRSWDGGLYHLQGVQWAKAYPVVPGIANLHGPLAFNNASFLYDAMLDSGWWQGRGFHLANGLLVFVMALQAIASGARFARGERWATGTRLYTCLLLAPAVYLARNGDVASYSTDVPLTLVLLAATAKSYELLDAGTAKSGSTEDAYGIFALSILFATAVCIKSSAAVFVAVAMPLAAWSWWKRGPRVKTGVRKTLVCTALTVVAFAIPWMARGVVMSGYPFFPLSVAGFPVDWRAPAEHADAEFAYIQFTEREFTWRRPISGNWLHLVFERDIYAVLIPTCLAASAVIGLAASRRKRRKVHDRSRKTWWLLLPVLAAIAAWLLSAPSTRYAAAFFWTLAGVCVCESWRALVPYPGGVARRWAVIGLLLLGVSPRIVEPALGAIRQGSSVVAAVLAYNIITPGPDYWFHTIAEQAEVTTFVTDSGLILNVPKKPRTHGAVAKPWNAPIPCTPNPAANLRLREPGRLDKGFRVDGGWQMQDWPYSYEPSFLREWRARRAEASAAHAP